MSDFNEPEICYDDKPIELQSIDNDKDNVTRIVNRQTQDDKDEQIRAWCNLDCSMCTASFSKFSHIKRHYRKEHNKNGFVICCSRKYFRQIHLLDHIFKHINPNAFK